MTSAMMKFTLLCMLMAWTVCACTLKNHTLWIERQDCSQCVAVNTTICSGYCYTQDTNLRGRFGRTFLIQRSCVPLSLVYRPAWLSGCPKDVNPQLFYPSAHRCSCSRCDTRSHRCLRTRRVSYDKCTSISGNMESKNKRTLET
ncbi:thyrotropin subunit beta-like [Cheilinus undulatus]|uniref:thyrotropin subunit beta-like n=1 Tax=Cheilinus undulatus TaxID=241271 RepID=UPI001BD6BDD9|nr:thyrotropin subunit beta-like [Cheilinus undulatus]